MFSNKHWALSSSQYAEEKFFRLETRGPTTLLKA